MKKRLPPTSLELFTGAGGLAIGVARAGFKHLGLVEWNRDACDTIRENAGRLAFMRGWDIYQQDVRAFDFKPYAGKVDLIAAGAPCQPFSLGGKHGGYTDERNMFPEVFRAARDVQPHAVVIENVKGLLRQNFRDYFEYILLSLEFPGVAARSDEEWPEHKTRLKALKDKGATPELHYNVEFQLKNAADYGLPQRRERVFIVALRSDLGIRWRGLAPTHSEDSLLYDQWVSHEYWEQHRLKAPKVPERLHSRIERLWSEGRPLLTDRWQTVRDALRGLPEPVDYEEHRRFFNHVGNPGARSYPGHDGSPLDMPAKTLKAGDHGVPGGENTLRYPDGTVRYFTVREAARLQGFPDEYRFKGAWCEGFRQLGNAVPVGLAQVVAQSVRAHLERRAGVMQVA